MKEESLKDPKGIKWDIESAVCAIESWRKHRKKRCPIPSELWEAAVELTHCYPFGYVAKRMNLNYRDFKRRLSQGENRESSQSQKKASCSIVPGEVSRHGLDSSRPLFVEVPMDGMLSPWTGSSCHVDLCDGGGLRIQVRVNGNPGIDIHGLCRLFLESRK